MKKNNIVALVVVIALFVPVIIGTIIYNNDPNKPVTFNKKDYEEKSMSYKFYNDKQSLNRQLPNKYEGVISDFSDDYKNDYLDGKTKYVVIKTSFNECHDEVNSVTYDFNDNTLEIYVDVEIRCGICAPYNYYIIKKADKNISNVKMYTKDINVLDCDPDIDY